MTLESSEHEFAARFAEYAATGLLYPQPEGSPLLEFVAGGRVLYLFDRLGPYTARPGRAQVVVHGVLEPASLAVLPAGPHHETLAVHGISALEGCGQILHAQPRTWIVQARLPLVLASFDDLPPVTVGQWITFKTVAPLHGFVLDPAPV